VGKADERMWQEIGEKEAVPGGPVGSASSAWDPILEN